MSAAVRKEERLPGKADEVADIQELAENYRLAVQGSSRGHYVAAERAETRGRVIGIASAVLGAAVGTSIFATIESAPTVNWRVVAGFLAIAAAVLGALHTFLDYSGRAAEYRLAGAAYGRLRRDFDSFFLELATSRDRLQLIAGLSRLRVRMDELGQESPLIPKRSYASGQRQIAAGKKTPAKGTANASTARAGATKATAAKGTAAPATEEAAQEASS
jgi:MFS family permease